MGPDCDNLGSAQREQSRCLGSPQSGEQLQGLSGVPPLHLRPSPGESRIIGFDLCPERSLGRDSGSCRPEGRGTCHSDREGPAGSAPSRGGGGGPCDRVPDADPLEFFFSLLKISDPYSVFLLLH